MDDDGGLIPSTSRTEWCIAWMIIKSHNIWGGYWVLISWWSVLFEMWNPVVNILWSTGHTNSIWNKAISLLVTICSLSQNQMILVLTPQSCQKMLNSQQEWYIQKNDRNINELYATLAIICYVCNTKWFSEWAIVPDFITSKNFTVQISQ